MSLGKGSDSILRWLPMPARLARLCGIAALCIVIVWAIYDLSAGQQLRASLDSLRDYYHDHRPPPPPPDHGGPSEGEVAKPARPPAPVHGAYDYLIPQGTRIIGLVFYGRKETVQVLDCYLKRNLKVNGGLLEEIIFAVNTDIESDLEFLEEILAATPQYRKFVVEKQYDAWLGLWEPVDIRDAVYVKIDDDVVFFEDHTVATVVSRLLEDPLTFAVSANVVNNPALSWVHNHLGVSYPYWPEMKKPRPQPPKNAWRASQLPSYEGPPEGPKDFNANGETPAPYVGHRWLPVRPPKGQNYDMSLTPAATLTYHPFGPSLNNWAAGAQLHYSFLQHLEEGTTNKYKFDVWDMMFGRVSINFFAMRGADIMDAFPFAMADDEEFLTEVLPKELNRRVLVDGRGLAVHFAFHPQRAAHNTHGLNHTDVLSRYDAYAQEVVCTAPREARGV